MAKLVRVDSLDPLDERGKLFLVLDNLGHVFDGLELALLPREHLDLLQGVAQFKVLGHEVEPARQVHH